MDLSKISDLIQEMVEHEFPVVTRGYGMKEVDAYLDEIIMSIKEIAKTNKELYVENQEAKNEIIELKKELRNLKAGLEAVKGSDKEVTNVDILRRLSHLEKIVYGQDN